MTTDKERVTVYLPSDIKARLEEISRQDRRSLTATIEVLLIEALETRDKKKG
ncbi:MAG: ribbon-helix-helix protein, CopG family [Leptolyngbya sp. IPPAS B-1204]|uniref:Ribbon-helix-helix protein, CopG family n=1 Tax=Leptolyngbya sp. NK1-12 TaxID=2547451 RepID=A0AA97AGI3_9CYAN|nr:ribbon-helix-helix protein, CopG family [Elainella sp. C42_A2020_010]RNJ69259.1 MAG: ribbon-helix-helix protein, CopG family [Leptolyngbya sp. IPPAS B-1204]WNZ23504.1 ribbon-helix-helix protein, CopG family [Leptolyngbya sp. NK1-12]